MRQQGRERACNMIDAPAETTAILSAIQQALTPEFRNSLRGMVNPYGSGDAAETITRVLTTVPLEGLLIKQPTPLASTYTVVDNPDLNLQLISNPRLFSGADQPKAAAALQVPLSSPDITQAEIDAVTAVLHTPHLSLGMELTAFESALADYHSTPHAVAVSSGTAGLHLSLLTLDVGVGDEVIVPSFAFVAVANAVLQVRATPVFAEIDPVTLNLDPSSVEQAVTPRTRAILVVHTFGLPAEVDALEAIARRHGLALIEDACESIGAEFRGRRAGSFGDLAVLGFYPNKQLTTGEGGAVIARDPAHAARLRSLRNQGRQPSGDWLDHAEVGYNYRLSELACALGRVQLSRIDEMLALRQQAAECYDALLREILGLELPPLNLPYRVISWFVYVVRLPERVDRERVRAALMERGIATGRYFAPIHLQPAWRAHPSAKAAALPITESIARRTLALPFFNRITPSQQEEVAKALRLVIGA
jgi:perosamine synthetase